MSRFNVHLEGGVGPLPNEIPFINTSEYMATTYLKGYENRAHLTGGQMVGSPCPSCGSRLVVRMNSFDSRRFVACDKSRKPRCQFTIGITETLAERTKRIESKLNR